MSSKGQRRQHHSSGNLVIGSGGQRNVYHGESGGRSGQGSAEQCMHMKCLGWRMLSIGTEHLHRGSCCPVWRQTNGLH